MLKRRKITSATINLISISKILLKHLQYIRSVPGLEFFIHIIKKHAFVNDKNRSQKLKMYQSESEGSVLCLQSIT